MITLNGSYEFFMVPSFLLISSKNFYIIFWVRNLVLGFNNLHGLSNSMSLTLEEEVELGGNRDYTSKDFKLSKHFICTLGKKHSV